MRGAQRRIDIQIDDKVRKYGHDGWFHEGVVSRIDAREDFVEVDFGDWIQRYPLAGLVEFWPTDGTYERCLRPVVIGVMVEDYRIDA